MRLTVTIHELGSPSGWQPAHWRLLNFFFFILASFCSEPSVSGHGTLAVSSGPQRCCALFIGAWLIDAHTAITPVGEEASAAAVCSSSAGRSVLKRKRGVGHQLRPNTHWAAVFLTLASIFPLFPLCVCLCFLSPYNVSLFSLAEVKGRPGTGRQRLHCVIFMLKTVSGSCIMLCDITKGSDTSCCLVFVPLNISTALQKPCRALVFCPSRHQRNLFSNRPCD